MSESRKDLKQRLAKVEEQLLDEQTTVNESDVREFANYWRTEKRQEFRRGEHGYDEFSELYRSGMSEGMAVMAEHLLMWLNNENE